MFLAHFFACYLLNNPVPHQIDEPSAENFDYVCVCASTCIVFLLGIDFAFTRIYIFSVLLCVESSEESEGRKLSKKTCEKTELKTLDTIYVSAASLPNRRVHIEFPFLGETHETSTAYRVREHRLALGHGPHATKTKDS